ncbi:MAG: cupin-like domain-containing protein [Chitinophagaceae bacterium]|jgi:hypothetical protein|nr:cupin-like domain-containing protein [Chitinophagaceae bacterium]OQY92479.1 MAG: transcriptional regulator [Sphingobacteriales bacterium UTBCD1]
MQLKPVTVVDNISPEDFKKDFYRTNTPLVIKNLSKDWPAREKWNWDYFKQLVGEKEVAVYNNIKSDAYTPINKADGYMKFGDYLDMVKKGPVELRIFLFNILHHAPQLVKDFTWPEEYMKGFVKKFPMLFVGGAGSITHMHFDIDLSHIIHTQFAGRKRILLFPFGQQHKLYRKPFEVLTLADFSRYYQDNSRVDYERFPALKFADGLDVTLEHGQTLFMPAGYWHHMEYLDSGFALSLRAMQSSLGGKIHGAWNLFGMRNIDTMMKRTMPKTWYNWKQKKIQKNASKELTVHN